MYLVRCDVRGFQDCKNGRKCIKIVRSFEATLSHEKQREKEGIRAVKANQSRFFLTSFFPQLL